MFRSSAALYTRRIWVLLALAVAVRLVLAVMLDTNGDIRNMEQVSQWLRDTPLETYSLQNGSQWPYLGGYLPLVWGMGVVSEALGVAFATLARLPVIAANVALAWLVDRQLVWRGSSDRTRLLSAAIVLFAPLFVLASGWHGQLDTAAVLLAAAAVAVWQRDVRHRALWAGLLLGGAIAIKTVPGFVVLALLPHVRNRRELAVLVAGVVMVPVLATAPWLLHDRDAVLHYARSYRGLPGGGGLGLLTDPSLAGLWLTGARPEISDMTLRLLQHQDVLQMTMLSVVGLGLLRWRPEPALGATLVVLAVYVGAVNWSLHYLIWVVPFLLLAGRVRAAAWLQVVLVIPVVMVYWPALDGTLATTATPWSEGMALYVYVPIMVALWAAAAATLVLGAAIALSREGLRLSRAAPRAARPASSPAPGRRSARRRRPLHGRSRARAAP